MLNHIEKHTKMVNSKLTPFTDERRLVEPESYTKSRHDDDVKWMISFAFSKEVQPMWVGWNAKKESDTFTKTRNILSTTDQSVTNFDSCFC